MKKVILFLSKLTLPLARVGSSKEEAGVSAAPGPLASTPGWDTDFPGSLARRS